MAFKKTPTAQPAKDASDFIAAAGQPVLVRTSIDPEHSYPWDGLRDDKPTEIYNLRLTEVQKAKLKYISDHGGVKSMQVFVMDALNTAIDAKIDELFNAKKYDIK